MALKVLQGNVLPLGQFDALDAQVTTVLGGEVACFSSVALTSGDKSAADVVADGYNVSGGVQKRVVATTTLVSGKRPLCLVDEGVSGYSSMLGTVQTFMGSGSPLGPHTATATGKWTLWDKPGVYAISLDAVDASINPDNTALDAGSALFCTSSGKLTATAASSFEIVGGLSLCVARFISFETNGSLVRTPSSMVFDTNMPPAQKKQFKYVVVHFEPNANLYV